jgi:prepilin-type N-terminal cleavage/methylation domain-containing protein
MIAARHHDRNGRDRRRAFSLVELLLAVFILGIGLIGISALFPAGIAQQRQASDDIMGPVVADSAVALLRSRLSPQQFGTLESFGQPQLLTTNTGTQPVVQATVEGDWTWRRPGFLFEDFQATPLVNEAGAIDIFTSYYSLNQLGATIDGVAFTGLNTSKLAAENYDAPGGGALPLGIPWNPRTGLPIVVITQGERAFPQVAEGSGSTQRPAYFWECMFRRFAGRIQVAVFVYRVSPGGGEPRPYSVAQGTGAAAVVPPLPFLFDLAQAPFAPLLAGGPDGNFATVLDNARVNTQNPTAAPAELPHEHTWQVPNQWLLDQYGDVHRVAVGRRNTKDNANITLTRPIPQQPPIPEVRGLLIQGDTVSGSVGTDPGGQFIWFIPTFDSQLRPLRAVYATVQEL